MALHVVPEGRSDLNRSRPQKFKIHKMAQWDMPTIFFLLLKDGILFNEIGRKGIHKYVFYSLSVKKEKSCYIDTVLYRVCKEALKPNKKIDSAKYPPRLGWFGNFISAALMALTLLVWPKPDRFLISSLSIWLLISQHRGGEVSWETSPF